MSTLRVTAPERLEVRRLFAAGDLDSAFGDDGVVREVPASLDLSDIELLAGDKLLVAGSASGNDSAREYLLRRYNADGSLDTTFGGDGIVTGRLGGIPTRINDIALINGSDFVAVGTPDDGAPDDRLLARFNADGSLDLSFSDDGFLEFTGFAQNVSVAADGSVLVFDTDEIRRFTPAGAVDTSFGTEGVALNILPNGFIGAIEPLQDGKILVGGGIFRGEPGSQTDIAIARINSDGSFDATFLAQGSTVVFSDEDTVREEITDIDVSGDGRIIATGSVGRPRAAIRFLADGQVDPSFGDAGLSLVDFGDFNSARETIIDGANQIYLSSAGGKTARLSSEGALDEQFGRVFGGGGFGGARLLSNGRLVSVGDVISTGIALVGRLTTDDGNPSPMSIINRTLTITGTSDDDRIELEDSPGVTIVHGILNGFGRDFAAADFDLIAVSGGDGGDRISAALRLARFSTQISGGNGRDSITGSDGRDTLRGEGGRDFIDGGLSSDLIVGGGGKDQLRGQGGPDRVYGREGNDYLEGGGDNDRLDGGAGTDVLRGRIGDDQFFSEDNEIDTLRGEAGVDTAIADEDDELFGVESID